jgi:ribosomal protein S18 acetylase RimI-like enzyme
MITYRLSPEGITAQHLMGGFFAGWPNPPSPETHLRILHGSSRVVIAWDADQVVGFITALTDGVCAAYIPHLEVLPAYQNRGIGSELVRRMLDQFSDIYMIDLICDADVQSFYARLGMQPCTGMIRRNYHAQSGTPVTERIET